LALVFCLCLVVMALYTLNNFDGEEGGPKITRCVWYQ